MPDTIFPSIGNFSSKSFHPQKYKLIFTNPAFDNLTDRDGYWGAKIVVSFTDEQIEAAVKTGQYSNPKAAEYLISVLKERRDIIGDYWFHKVNPLDDFRLEQRALADPELRFTNLAVKYGLENNAFYRYTIHYNRMEREALSIFEFMIASFAACMVLIGILGYFGIHVLKREIIFIDIAMAQIAALGMTFAFLLNIVFHSNLGYLLSVGFTTIAASVFAAIKDEDLHIPLEAIIGLSYAIATTAAVLIIDRAPGGAEHIKEMLVGSILFVSWEEIIKAGVAFVIVGILHYVFRNKFISISENSQKASESGINVKLWNFIFYISLGIAVIHAVRIGGILMVFAFLLIPSSISILFSKSWTARIFIAWLVGTIVSMGGLYLSWVYNLPSGPAVIIFLGIFFFLALTVKKLNLLKSS